MRVKRKNKILALFLILAFFSGVFCALGQDTATEGGQTTAVESNGQTSETPTQTPAEKSKNGAGESGVQTTEGTPDGQDPGQQTIEGANGESLTEGQAGEQQGQLETEANPEGSISAEATVTIVEPPAAEAPEENQPVEGDGQTQSEVSEPLTTSDPATINNPTAPPAEIKEVTIEQDIYTGQYTDTQTGERVDVADLSQSVVIEANNQVIDVVATVEVIDQIATAIINGEQNIVVIGDGNVINVIANILAAVSDLFVDWSQTVHIHGDNNVVNAQVNIDATVKNTADINTRTRLEINLPDDVPSEVVQSIVGISYGEYGGNYLAPKAPVVSEIPTSIDLKMNEVLYQDGGSIIEAVEFINGGEANQSYLIGALKLRFVNMNTGEVDAIVDLVANPDPTNPNHVILPGEIKVKDLTDKKIMAMDERVDLIGYFTINGIPVVKRFDSVECTWSGIRDARARQHGMSVDDVSESRNPDGRGNWEILTRTKGGYNNPYGLSKNQLFNNSQLEKYNDCSLRPKRP